MPGKGGGCYSGDKAAEPSSWSLTCT